MHKNFVKFLQSVVVLPVMITSPIMAPMLGTNGLPTAAVISPEKNMPLSSVVAPNHEKDHALKVKKVDAYFAKYDLPMEGYGEKLVSAAEENELPPYILASIAFNESTGCKFMIKGTNNCFGWGGGKIRFKSMDEAITTIAQNISGNDEDTAHHYSGKTIPQILTTYNGAGVNPRYVKNVLMVMDQIEKVEVTEPIVTQSDQNTQV